MRREPIEKLFAHDDRLAVFALLQHDRGKPQSCDVRWIGAPLREVLQLIFIQALVDEFTHPVAVAGPLLLVRGRFGKVAVFLHGHEIVLFKGIGSGEHLRDMPQSLWIGDFAPVLKVGGREVVFLELEITGTELVFGIGNKRGSGIFFDDVFVIAEGLPEIALRQEYLSLEVQRPVRMPAFRVQLEERVRGFHGLLILFFGKERLCLFDLDAGAFFPFRFGRQRRGAARQYNRGCGGDEEQHKCYSRDDAPERHVVYPVRESCDLFKAANTS